MRRALVAGAVLLAGCASTPGLGELPYELSPEARPVAIELRTLSDPPHFPGADSVEVTVFEPGNCAINPRGGRLATVEATSPGAETASRAAKLAADESVALTFVRHTRSALNRSMCPYTVLFRPEADFEYLAVYDGRGGFCHVTVTRRAARPGSEWGPDPSLQESPLCLSDRMRERMRQDYTR